MFTVDWTLNIANIFNLLIFILGGCWAIISMKEDLRIVKYDIINLRESVKVLNEAFRQMGDILTKVAVQDNRLTMMDKYIDELRHGRGFIKED